MSYSTAGYMHCEPFVYWGDLEADWQEFVARVDPGDYLFKLRYMSEALAYLDKVHGLPNIKCRDQCSGCHKQKQ